MVTPLDTRTVITGPLRADCDDGSKARRPRRAAVQGCSSHRRTHRRRPSQATAPAEDSVLPPRRQVGRAERQTAEFDIASCCARTGAPQSGRASGSHEVCEAAGRNETVHRCQLEGALDQLQGAWGLDAAGDARRTRPARLLAVKSLIADPPAPPRRHARDTTGLEETHWNGPPRREGSGVSSRKRGRGHHSPL